MNTPHAEVEITTDLVQGLLNEQFPTLARQPLSIAFEGWDNVMVRIGSDVAARMPRRAAGAHMGKAEAQWLRVLAPRLPIRIPTPLALGVPGSNYPWDWSIVPWVDGDNAAVQLPATSEAERFGFFLRALHTPPPDGLPFNPSRSVSLKQRDDEARVRRLSNEGWELWTAAAEEDIDIASSWIHGDLHPKNVIVADRKVVSIIDWGDTCPGDPATDIASFWMLFPGEESAFRKGYGPISSSTWLRAQGWAITFSSLFLGLGDDPDLERVGRLTWRALGCELGI